MGYKRTPNDRKIFNYGVKLVKQIIQLGSWLLYKILNCTINTTDLWLIKKITPLI